MALLQNIWWMLVLIGVMVIIHELGHYWAARWFKIRVEAFSIGFGPRLFGFRRGETDFKVCAIPFGGYVKMSGEQPGEEVSPDSFLAKPRWQRLIVAAAGPAMNIILAIALLAGLYTTRYPKVAGADDPATIGYIVANSPAAKAGLKEGDTIVQVDDHADPKWEDVRMAELVNAGKSMVVVYERDGQRDHVTMTPELDERIGGGVVGWSERGHVLVAGVEASMDAARKGLTRGDVIVSANGQRLYSVAKLHEVIRETKGQPVDLVLERNQQRRNVTVTPTYSEDDKRFLLGVQLDKRVTFVSLPVHEAVRESMRDNARGAGLILSFLRGLVERRLSAKSLEGPVRIAQLSGEAAREGSASFVNLMAMVSLNLAVFNLLPIPILDGGVILLLLIEMVMRRDLSLQVKEAVIKAGFVFLLMVVGFVLYNDISKILPG